LEINDFAIAGPTMTRNAPTLIPGKQPFQQSSSLRYIIDCGYTFFMNGEELPYVSNTWDAHAALAKSMVIRPPSYEYYVPPLVSDDDFFGGQVVMWQMKMMQYFGKCRPDIWRIQAVPDLHRNSVDWIHFTITTKLRFCCRVSFKFEINY
jgi:hypothetical protein